MNGEKIMKADAIAVMKLWAVEQSPTSSMRYEIKLHRKQIRNSHPKLLSCNSIFHPNSFNIDWIDER